jgi:hypothetical protein
MEPHLHHCLDIIFWPEVIFSQMLLQSWAEMEIRWSQVCAEWWVVNKCEIKKEGDWFPAVIYATVWWPHIVILERNIHHFKTNSSNMCLQFLCNLSLVLRVSGGISRSGFWIVTMTLPAEGAVFKVLWCWWICVLVLYWLCLVYKLKIMHSAFILGDSIAQEFVSFIFISK